MMCIAAKKTKHDNHVNLLAYTAEKVFMVSQPSSLHNNCIYMPRATMKQPFTTHSVNNQQETDSF